MVQGAVIGPSRRHRCGALIKMGPLKWPTQLGVEAALHAVTPRKWTHDDSLLQDSNMPRLNFE